MRKSCTARGENVIDLPAGSSCVRRGAKVSARSVNYLAPLGVDCPGVPALLVRTVERENILT